MSVPIRAYVNLKSRSLTAGGGITQLRGCLLTSNFKVTSEQQLFHNTQEVAEAFGEDAAETRLAAVYFAGYVGASGTPSDLVIYKYNRANFTNKDTMDWGALMDTCRNQTPSFDGYCFIDNLSTTDKEAIALWNGQQNDRFWCVLWDNNVQDTYTPGDNNGSFGAWLKGQTIEGVTPVYSNADTAVFLLSIMASVDFSQQSGRVNLMYRRAPSLVPTVSDSLTRDNLIGNGYSFLVDAGNGDRRFQFLDGGMVSGQFNWADSYINQMWLILQLKLDLLTLLIDVPNIPYSPIGDAYISSAVSDTIAQAKRFGVIQTGVRLSALQEQQANRALGHGAAQLLTTNGYVLRPNASTTPPAARDKRGAPPSQFWYTDGQSIQKLSLSTTGVE